MKVIKIWDLGIDFFLGSRKQPRFHEGDQDLGIDFFQDQESNQDFIKVIKIWDLGIDFILGSIK